MVKFFGNNTNNNPVAEQSSAEENDVKENLDTQNNKLILIKGKVAEKGVKSFLRCGTKFTNEYQELKVDKPTLARLKAEPKLTIQIVK